MCLGRGRERDRKGGARPAHGRARAQYPWYGWHANKGYAAPEHRAALAEIGPCKEHRKSWHLIGTDEPDAHLLWQGGSRQQLEVE